MTQPRTLLLSEIFPPKVGGSGRWFWEIYSRLPRDGYVIAAGEDPRQGEFDATHDLDVHRLPLTLRQWGLRSWEGATSYWRAIRGLRKLARGRAVGMVHCGRCLPEGVMALALKWTSRIPYLCYVHGEDVNTARQSREHAFLVGRVLRNATLLVANSHNTAQLLRDDWHMPQHQVCVLHPGVDTRRFVPAARDEAVRRSLGWEGRRVVLTVGRLQRRKGQDRLIEALVQVRATIPDVLYVIVGGGEDREYLEDLAARRGVTEAVQFRGETTDAELVQCYQQCDLFALPNRQIGQDIEGFGMVLLEAQACGRPVVAGASGGTAETMQIGVTGQVVACDTAEPLAALLADLLADTGRLDRMGAAGRTWVETHFAWESLVRQAAVVFREAGDTGRSAGVASGEPQQHMVPGERPSSAVAGESNGISS